MRSSDSCPSRVVTIAPAPRSEGGRAGSRTSPPTLTASAARASPGPMAAASSAPEAPSGSSFCEPSGRITCMERGMLDAAGLRAAVRSGEYTGPTAGLAPGFTQANLVALPEADAFDFLRFCVQNPKPCPVLDVTDPGSPEPAQTAPGTDLRTDLPRYRVWREGELADEPDDVSEHWRDDLVGFLIGCSFTFERALQAEGLPIRHVEQGINVPMYRTAIDCTPAGRFSGPLVVSMRPMTPPQAIRATQITSRYGPVHGGPVHVGAPR